MRPLPLAVLLLALLPLATHAQSSEPIASPSPLPSPLPSPSPSPLPSPSPSPSPTPSTTPAPSLVSASSTPSAAPSPTPRSLLVADLNFVVGEKRLEREGWGDDLDRQLATGLETTFSRANWPVGIAADLLFSNHRRRRGWRTAEERIIEGGTIEAGLGLRAVMRLRDGRVRPFVGAGVEIAQAEYAVRRRFGPNENRGAGDFGWWVNGGVFGRFGTSANVGVTVRWSRATVESDSFGPAEAGGLVYAVVAGFGFPSQPKRAD